MRVTESLWRLVLDKSNQIPDCRKWLIWSNNLKQSVGLDSLGNFVSIYRVHSLTTVGIVSKQKPDYTV